MCRDSAEGMMLLIVEVEERVAYIYIVSPVAVPWQARAQSLGVDCFKLSGLLMIGGVTRVIVEHRGMWSVAT